VTLNVAKTPFTGMAQGKRAGLITPRSLVRTQFPVFYNSPALQKLVVIAHATKNMSTHLLTPLAQLAERQAHNLEVGGSKPPGGILHFARFIETRGHSSSDLKHEHQCCRCSSAEERLKPDLRHIRPAMVRQWVDYPLITGRT